MSVRIVGLDVSEHWRVTQLQEIRCEDKKLLTECLRRAEGRLSGSEKLSLLVGNILRVWGAAVLRHELGLEGTEEFVEFVGGVEIGF
jgi:hypothetical protein